MNTRRLMVFLLILGTLGGWFVMRKSTPDGPLYQGRQAVYWVREYTRHKRKDDKLTPAKGQDMDLRPVLELGTNAIPHLLLECAYENVLPLQDQATRLLTFGIRDYGQNDIRVNSHDAVRQIGPRAVPALFEALKSADERMRRPAAACLAYFHKSSDEIVPALVRTLGDPSVNVRASAATALGSLGFGGQDAVEPLLNWIELEPSFFAVTSGADAVRKIDPKNPRLRTVLSRLASAREIRGVPQNEVTFLNQAAARLLSELESTSGPSKRP